MEVSLEVVNHCAKPPQRVTYEARVMLCVPAPIALRRQPSRALRHRRRRAAAALRHAAPPARIAGSFSTAAHGGSPGRPHPRQRLPRVRMRRATRSLRHPSPIARSPCPGHMPPPCTHRRRSSAARHPLAHRFVDTASPHQQHPALVLLHARHYFSGATVRVTPTSLLRAPPARRMDHASVALT